MWLFLILIAIPVIEIALFIELGGFIGVWATIALVIGTAILGAALLRAQGFAAMSRLQASLAEGGDPRGPMAHGVMILIAGMLMLTPGFFTDTIGFLLLIPSLREAAIKWAGPKIAARVVTMGPTGAGFDTAGRGEPHHEQSAPIDAEYVDLTDGPPREGGSGWSKPPEDERR